MIQNACPLRENRQVRRALQIQNPTPLLSLIVMFEADLPERLEQLISAVVDPVRLAQKGDDYIPVGSLIENHFGMTCSNDLAVGMPGGIDQKLVCLPLPQCLQVGV